MAAVGAVTAVTTVTVSLS